VAYGSCAWLGQTGRRTDRGIALVMVDDSSDGIATLWRHCCYDTP